MSGAWDEDPERITRAVLAAVDYMPPANPQPTPVDAARLWDIVLADVVSDRDRARGEYAHLAEPGTSEAKIADARERQWRAMHPGFAALLDLPGGVR